MDPNSDRAQLTDQSSILVRPAYPNAARLPRFLSVVAYVPPVDTGLRMRRAQRSADWAAVCWNSVQPRGPQPYCGAALRRRNTAALQHC